MNFTQIDYHFSECDAIIGHYSGTLPEALKDRLCRAMILEIVSTYEQMIEQLFLSRIRKTQDQGVINFGAKQLNQTFRSPDLGKINKMLEAFDSATRNQFWTRIENTPVHAAWDNVMKARHHVVHKNGSFQLTYDELKRAYRQTQNVLTELDAALS